MRSLTTPTLAEIEERLTELADALTIHADRGPEDQVVLQRASGMLEAARLRVQHVRERRVRRSA